MVKPDDRVGINRGKARSGWTKTKWTWGINLHCRCCSQVYRGSIKRSERRALRRATRDVVWANAVLR